MSGPQDLHLNHDIATSFGNDPQRYDRTRTKCPPELLARLVSLSGGRDVLDVGTGTGIVARQLKSAGCSVSCIEPDTRMAQFAAAYGLSVEVSTFEAWDRGSRAFGLITAGASWHWIDPLTGACKAAEALEPDGWLAPFWHTYHLPESVGHAYEVAVRRAAPRSPLRPWFGQARNAAYAAIFDSVTDGIIRSGRFDAPAEWHCQWNQTYTRDDWLDRIPTQGILDKLGLSAQLEILTTVGAAIDDIGGQFTLSYDTVAILARRAAA